MKVKDLIGLEIDVDITTDIFDDPYCAFVGPIHTTKYGESYWEEVLNLNCELVEDRPLAVIEIPGTLPDNEQEEVNEGIKEFFAALAGYCSIPEYQSWFVD